TIEPRLLSPEISIDAEINLEDITPKFYRILKQFAPFGPGNMTPTFMTQHLMDTGWGKCVGEDKTHLRVVVKQGNSTQFTGIGFIKCLGEDIAPLPVVVKEGNSPYFTGIGFGMSNKHEIACNGTPFKAVYCIDEYEWQGNISLQRRLKDVIE